MPFLMETSRLDESYIPFFSHLNIYLANSTSRPSSSFVPFIHSLTNHSTSYTRSRVCRDERAKEREREIELLKKMEKRENNYSATTNQNTYIYEYITCRYY
jgi:hypothetical protein